MPGTSATSLFTYWTDLTSSSRPALHADPQGPTSTPTPRASIRPPRGSPSRARAVTSPGSARRTWSSRTTRRTSRTCTGRTSSQYAFGNWSYNTAYDQYNERRLEPRRDRLRGPRDSLLARRQPRARPLLAGERGRHRTPCRTSRAATLDYNALFGALNIDPALTGKPDQAAASELHADRRHPTAARRLAGAAGLRRVRAKREQQRTVRGARPRQRRRRDHSPAKLLPARRDPDDGDPRLHRQRRLPGLRRDGGQQRPGLYRGGPGSRGPRHIHVPLGRPRRPVLDQSR